jgi:hypothetical protein
MIFSKSLIKTFSRECPGGHPSQGSRGGRISKKSRDITGDKYPDQSCMLSIILRKLKSLAGDSNIQTLDLGFTSKYSTGIISK